MENLTQDHPKSPLVDKGLKIASGLVICGVLSTGLAAGLKHGKIDNDQIWDSQLQRMLDIADWYEDHGNGNAAFELRDRHDDCIYKHERCPEQNEFETITELTLQNADGTEEEYVALH